MLMKFWALQQAKREKRHFEFKSIKLSHKLPRIEKQITNIQKIYQKKQTQLESQSKMYQSQMEQQMRAQMMGGGYSSGSFGAGLLGGIAGSIFNQIAMNGFQQYQEGGNDTQGLDATKFQEGLNGNTSGWTNEMLAIMNNIKNQAASFVQMSNQMMEQNITNMKLMLEQQKEMMIAQMEEEQEAALLPLNEEQTETELEKTYVETRLTELKEEIETLKSECAEEAKDAAPKFGLA